MYRHISLPLSWGCTNVKSDSYNASNRDRYIHSKGHACEVLYDAIKSQFFSENLLDTYGQNGSSLGGHVDSNLPGIELSTGSLGNGLGFGAGMALGSRLQGHNYSTFVMMGDGECYEGSVWEAVSFAGHHKLGNLIGIVDRNEKSPLAILKIVMLMSLSGINGKPWLACHRNEWT